MKRTLLTLAVMAVALLAAKPDAQAGDGAKMVTPGLALLLARGSLVVLDARRQLDGVDRLDLDSVRGILRQF